MAREYARFRPAYPGPLFAYLATLPPSRSLAWDCATGSGQAASGLADHFERVIATDISEELLAKAASHPRIDFRQAPATASGLEEGSVDLITVAQAVHWFHGDDFDREVRRVLRPKGIIAVWSYAFASITPEVDAVVRKLHFDIVDPFWLEQNRLIERGYRTISFPYTEIDAPAFEMSTQFILDQLIGYLGTWSAVAKYHKHHGVDPVGMVRKELDAAWGDPGHARPVVWPLQLRVGRL